MFHKYSLAIAAVFWVLGVTVGFSIGWVLHEPTVRPEVKCPTWTPERSEFRLMCKAPDGRLHPCTTS